MKLRRFFPLGFVLALALAGCTPDVLDAPSPVSETPEVTLGRAPSSALPATTEISTTPVSTRRPPPQQPSQPPAECGSPHLDLMSTPLGAWLGSQIIPTDQPGTSYYFSVADNQFDPCVELSWVTLSGTNGNAGQDDGNGSRFVHAVVFFAGEELITEPAPRQFNGTAAVERIDARSITVTHRDTDERGTETAPITYTLAEGQLLGEGQLPPDRRDNVRLDLTRAGPPAEGAPRPYGNANYRPWDEERPMGRQYSLMMGEEEITCDFALFNGVQLVCYSETSTPWPRTREIPEEKGTSANIARLNFQDPWEIRTSTGTFPAPGSDFEMLPGGSVTRIGDIFIDTRSEVVKIHDVNRAYLLGEGVAEPVEVPTFQLDTSRHPQDLLRWEG